MTLFASHVSLSEDTSAVVRPFRIGRRPPCTARGVLTLTSYLGAHASSSSKSDLSRGPLPPPRDPCFAPVDT